jgi:uncharacterized protein YjbI with pentapeptide repeats
MWATACMLTLGCQFQKNGASSGSQPVEKHTAALSGENLAGANLAGANLAGNNLAGNNLAGSNLAGTNLAGANMGGTNLAGSNLAGSNLAGNNLAGTNLAGNNLAGSNLAGSNLAGSNLAGSNLAGSNLAGSNLAGSNLAGSNLAGANLAGNNLAGTNLAGSNLAGANSGMNIHGVTGTVGGMLYSGEDVWGTMEERCVVMGIGSTAFAKLLGQQTANSTINVALGKLPWGFAPAAGTPATLKAWEAVVWGDRTYCSFVLVAPNDATWNGVAGFIKAIFRWQAPPTQSMYISGIEASAPNDSTLSTSLYTYTGMMDTANQWRQGKINDKNLVAGQVAFISATTNNQSVMVDFSSWVMDSTNLGLILGNVQSANPPTRAESVYYAVDNGDGTVSVRIAAAGSGLTAVTDTYEALNSDWEKYQDNLAAKPVPRRCGGALFLNYYYGEPVPAGKCDDGLSWANASSAADSRKWSTVSGTTAPMSSYMLLPKDATHPLKRGVTADTLQVVLSETYVHTWDAASDPATGLTVVDDSVTGTGLNQFNYAGDDSDTWGHSTSGTDAFKSTNAYEGAAGNYATFTFQGTQVQLYMVKDPGHGIGAISIDNGPETLVDLYSPARKAYQLMWAAGNLYPGVNHTMKIRVTGSKDPRSTGSNVSIDAAVVSNAASCTIEPDSSFCARQGKNCGSVTAIDNCGATRTVAFCGSCASPMTCGGAGEDNVCGNGSVTDDWMRGTAANQFNFSGSWNTCRHCGNGSLYAGTRSQSKTSNDTMTFPFTGVKATLYGLKAPSHGIGAVSIDNGAETNIDFYNATLIGDQLLWTSPVLAAGNHTLKVRVTNTKSSSATDTYVVVDRVAVQATVMCTPEDDATFCSRLAKNCGAVAATDNCGNSRSVASCGACAFGETCGSGICAAPASNLFSNASFASGTSGWITYFYPGAGTFGTDATGQDSSAGAKFTIPSSYTAGVDWHAQAYQTRVADGGPYTMSFWFQKTEGSSKKVSAFCTEEGGNYASWWTLPECTNTTGWTQCSVTCTPPAGKLAKFGVSAAWDSTDVRIDNMMLVSGTAAPAAPPPPPACVAESDATFCTRLAKSCGSVTAADNCGTSRTVASCGTCAAGDTCTANACVTPPPPVNMAIGVSSDAYVRDGANASINYGTATTLEVKNWTQSGNTRHSHLTFGAMTALPANTASVKIRLYGAAVASSKAVSIYAVSTTTWTESGLTYGNAPAAGTKLATVTVTTTNQWYDFDITSYALAEKAAGRATVSFVLKSDTVSNDSPVSFYSKQNSSSNKPYIVVQ